MAIFRIVIGIITSLEFLSYLFLQAGVFIRAEKNLRH